MGLTLSTPSLVFYLFPEKIYLDLSLRQSLLIFLNVSLRFRLRDVHMLICFQTMDILCFFILSSNTQQILIAFPLTNKLVIGFQGKRRLNRFWERLYNEFPTKFNFWIFQPVRISLKQVSKVIFHFVVHWCFTKSPHSLDFQTDNLSKLKITISREKRIFCKIFGETWIYQL